eukprot:scaffold1477_cov148-Isochrysis_galbana.AAC.1
MHNLRFDIFLSPSSREKASTFEAHALHARFGVRVLVFVSSATCGGVGLARKSRAATYGQSEHAGASVRIGALVGECALSERHASGNRQKSQLGSSRFYWEDGN